MFECKKCKGKLFVRDDIVTTTIHRKQVNGELFENIEEMLLAEKYTSSTIEETAVGKWECSMCGEKLLIPKLKEKKNGQEQNK